MIDPFALPRLYPLATPPEPEKNWALFFDLDGTLLEIARTPDSVVVPHDLIRDLAAASTALGGALAVVSGRPLAEVDALLAPLRLPGAGEHGAVVRLPCGSRDEVDDQVPGEWAEALTDAAADKEGVSVERKVHSVVVHYRRAPRFEGFFKHLCAELIQGAASEFEILQGKMAVEIRPKTVTKARAVELLMQGEPFRGRKPIFVGDDVTDQDGFRAAEAFGGKGLDVFVRFAGLPLEVRRWLKSIGRL
ncbi:MAG: trehalose-phosphatase [Alphaproteobacteria bacterium]|nr:trehalose-phosphatase [Alphaproteobacteria bacterium]